MIPNRKLGMMAAMLAASISMPTIGRQGLVYRASNVSTDNIVTFPSRRYLARLRHAAQNPGRR